VKSFQPTAYQTVNAENDFKVVMLKFGRKCFLKHFGQINWSDVLSISTIFKSIQKQNCRKMQNDMVEKDQNSRKLGLKITNLTKKTSNLRVAKVKIIENDETVKRLSFD